MVSKIFKRYAALTGLTRALVQTLTIIAVAIVLLSGIFYTLTNAEDFAPTAWFWLWERFDVAAEVNFASMYGATLWLLLSAITAFVGVLADRKRGNWFFISAVAAYAALDEVTILHEQLYLLGDYIRAYIPLTMVSYTWVIVGVLQAIIVSFFSLPLLVKLPRGVQLGLIVGGTVFLLGAVVMETIGGHIEMHFMGQVTWHLRLEIHLEELFEYLGVIIAIGAVSQMLLVEKTAQSVKLGFRGYRGHEAKQLTV